MMVLSNYIHVQYKNEKLKDSTCTPAQSVYDCPCCLTFLVKLICFNLFTNLLNLKILCDKILYVE